MRRKVVVSLRRVARRVRRERLIFSINMDFVHDQSCEYAKSELDVFSVPPTQTCIEYDNYVEYHPLGSITDSRSIEFDVSSSGQNDLDFSNTQLLIKVKLTRGNGVDITDADQVGGVYLFLKSLFQQVDVSLNDAQVSPTGCILNHSSAMDPKRKTINLLLLYFTRTLLAIWIVLTRLMPMKKRGTFDCKRVPRLLMKERQSI